MDPKPATVSGSVKTIIAVALAQRSQPRQSQFHQRFISALRREVIAVYLSFHCLYSQGAVQSSVTCGRRGHLIAFQRKGTTNWTNDL